MENQGNLNASCSEEHKRPLELPLPISLAPVLRSKTFIGLWMGPQYSEISGTVLQILVVSQFFGIADGTAASIMMAIDKHKPVAKWAVIEAALNLGLTLVLVKTIGIYGVAWGTSIALTFVHLVFWPRYIRQVLAIPVRTFLWEGWTKITLSSIPRIRYCMRNHRPILARQQHSDIFSPDSYYLASVCDGVVAAFRTEARSLFQKWQTSRTGGCPNVAN